MRSYHPDAVIAFGGFLSPPYVLLGWLSKRYVALHEANRIPGKAVRILARFADRIYLPVGVRMKGIRKSRISDSGYPLRREVRHLKKDLAKRKLGFSPQNKTLVVIGGSQGARALNDWVNEHYALLAKDGINVISVTGPGKGAESNVELQSSLGDKVRASFLSFTDDIGLLFSVADLVVSRAGAGAIAELTECLAPAILVPYPFAADRHQEANAEFFALQGCCIVVPQEELDARLLREVRQLIFNDGLLHRMRENQRALARGDAAEACALDLERHLDAFIATTRHATGKGVSA